MTKQEAAAINEAAKKYVSEHCANGTHLERCSNMSFIAGAKALDEMRKPSFDNRAKIQELLWDFSCEGTADPNVITEEIIRLAQNCEMSENSGQVDEDLVKKITDILLKNHHGAGFTIPDFKVTAFKIASLIRSSPNGENDIKIPEMIVTKKF